MTFSFLFLFVLIFMSFDDLTRWKALKFFWPIIFLILSYGVSSKIIEDEYKIFYFLIENDLENNINFWQIFREKGWLFASYTKLTALLNLGSYIYIMIPVFISLLIQKNFFYTYSSLPSIAMFIYFGHAFIVRESITLRSGISASIILLLIIYAANRKFLKFFIYLLIASGIHYVSLLGGLLLFLRKLYSFNFYILLFISCLFISYFELPSLILNFVAKHIYVINLYVGSDYFDPISFNHPKLLQQFLVGIFLIFLTRNYRKLIDNNEILILSINCYLLSTFFFIFFKDFGLIAFRVATMFSVVEPFLIVYILRSIFEKKSAWFLGLIFSIAIYFLNYILLFRHTIFLSEKDWQNYTSQFNYFLF